MRQHIFSIGLFVGMAFAASAVAEPVKISIDGSDDAAKAGGCKQIQNICELQAIGKTAASRAASYCLANDIDASKISTCGKSTSFQPIGTSIQPFKGTLNGKGFSVRNLSLVVRSAAKDAEIGLFGHVGKDAFVHDVGLIDVTVEVTSDQSLGIRTVGGLAGTNDGRIQNSFVTGAVNCLSSRNLSSGLKECYVGGLIGMNSGVLRNAFSMAVTQGEGGNQAVGSLVGRNADAATVSVAYGLSPVTCLTRGARDQCDAGGLLGTNISSGLLSSLFATGSVRTGDIGAACQGSCWVGGLIGDQAATGPGSIGRLWQSFATGTVSCFGEYDCRAGGLAGYFVVHSVNSYATGAVTCSLTNTDAGCVVGGLAGITGAKETILRSFAAGEVNCINPDTSGCDRGGVTAVVLSYPYRLAPSAYWDIETTKQTHGVVPQPLWSSGGGTGLTTLQLQSALPAAFDPAIWAISYGASYPYLTVANRWVPAVSSPSRTFPSRTTSFWGSLALAETKQGRFAVFPAGQIFPWEYHDYTKRNVSSNSMAANFAMLGRLIGSGKPKARVPYDDRTSDPLSLAKIDYFTGADGAAAWPLSNPNFADVKFFAGAMPVEDPAKATPAFFNRADILTQLENGRLVMLQGPTGQASTHWMLATAIMKNQSGNVTGIVANDPLLGQQVVIDMVPGSPTFRQVTEPADYQALSGITFTTARYFSVALK